MRKKYFTRWFFLLVFMVVFISTAHADVLSDYKLHSVQKDIILKALKEFKAKAADNKEPKQEAYNIIQEFIDKTQLEEEKLVLLKKNELLWPEEIVKYKEQIKGTVQFSEHILAA
ncbi:MAG: hypothetical protein OXD32_07020 [Endozoicomonadaceae bacterium]|nr:hypothetical protein [Endozoicomonadaceae bacterium]